MERCVEEGKRGRKSSLIETGLLGSGEERAATSVQYEADHTGTSKSNNSASYNLQRLNEAASYNWDDRTTGFDR